ncbi:MAG: cell cycle transcriptional regulator TrcR [Acetobacterales bacterium]
MTELLMPKATAVWLVENTTLTFEQIADFCGMHALEVQAIADGEVAAGIVGLDPVANGQVTAEDIRRCEEDDSARLTLQKSDVVMPKRQKGARYTPVSKRQDRPNAIAWLLKTFPEFTDAQICKLVGTTKPTIKKIRDRTHPNTANINPQDPVLLGICSREEFRVELEKARAKESRMAKRRGEEEGPLAAEEAPALAEDTVEPTVPDVDPDEIPDSRVGPVPSIHDIWPDRGEGTS